MWSPKVLRKTTFEVQFRMTPLGAPLLDPPRKDVSFTMLHGSYYTIRDTMIR
jgi:hypothetical protein